MSLDSELLIAPFLRIWALDLICII